MNLNELITEVRYLISDTDTNNPKWTDTILTNRLNLAQLSFVGLTDAIKSNNASDPEDVVSGTAGYSLPTDCLKLVRVSFNDANGYWKQLREITKEELDLNNGKWEDNTDDEPSLYINNMSGNNVLLYPIPNVTRADALRFEYVKKPTELSATTPTTEALDAQGNLEVFHESLAYYVAFKCKTDEKKLDEAKNYFGLWMKGVDDAQKQLASRVEDQRIVNIYEQCRKGPLRMGRFSTNPFYK